MVFRWRTAAERFVEFDFETEAGVSKTVAAAVVALGWLACLEPRFGAVEESRPDSSQHSSVVGEVAAVAAEAVFVVAVAVAAAEVAALVEDVAAVVAASAAVAVGVVDAVVAAVAVAVAEQPVELLVVLASSASFEAVADSCPVGSLETLACRRPSCSCSVRNFEACLHQASSGRIRLQGTAEDNRALFSVFVSKTRQQKSRLSNSQSSSGI